MGKIYNESKPRVILLTDGPRSRAAVIDALMLTKDKKQMFVTQEGTKFRRVDGAKKGRPD